RGATKPAAYMPAALACSLRKPRTCSSPKCASWLLKSVASCRRSRSFDMLRIAAPSAMLSVASALLMTFGVASGDKAADPPLHSPLSPEEALQTFRLPDDLRIELFAAEPHVQSPVAMAFDENGRIYVVEMSDYPLGKRGGRVKLLQDTDGDGRIDRSTVFADKLAFP